MVFTLRRALGPGEYVTQANPRQRRRLALGPSRGRRWFFWMDLQHGALFAHPSRAMTIDDRTGRVLQRTRLRWYPLIGRKPAYMRSRRAYRSRFWQIYNRTRGRPRRAVARPSTLTRHIPFGGRRNGPFGVPRSRFARDCMATIGDRSDEFAPSYAAMESFASDMDIPSRGAASSLDGLRRAVGEALAERRECDDVLIYLAGHGIGAEDGPPGVVVDPVYGRDGNVLHNRSEVITPEDLRSVLLAHPRVTFKVKITSCFSGRFVTALRTAPNLRVLETSSSADLPSFFDLPNGFILPDGSVLLDPTDNPQGADEFTNGNVHGLYEWARMPDTGEGLAEGIRRSFELGKDENIVFEATDPQMLCFREMPLGIVVEGRWRFFGGGVIEVEYQGVIRGRAGHVGRRASSDPATELVVDAPGGRTIVNHLCPSQLPNGTRMGGRLTCTGGSLPLNTPFTLNVQTTPPPAAGMGGQISARQGGRLHGPFPISGP